MVCAPLIIAWVAWVADRSFGRPRAAWQGEKHGRSKKPKIPKVEKYYSDWSGCENRLSNPTIAIIASDWSIRAIRAIVGLLHPEGPARHLDASRQKLTPHCLAAIFDSQLPSPKLSLKMPPKLPLPRKTGLFFFLQNYPRDEGNCAAIERQKLSRGNFCLAASRCLSRPSGQGPKKPLPRKLRKRSEKGFLGSLGPGSKSSTKRKSKTSRNPPPPPKKGKIIQRKV